jgi:thiaminase (transcriptional activator TenA)
VRGAGANRPHRESLSAEEEAKVTEHFMTTSRYEWMFWDIGLRRESWPI